jgi:hypothetical protein
MNQMEAAMTDSTVRDSKVSEKSQRAGTKTTEDSSALTDKEADAAKGGVSDIVVTKSQDQTSPR